MNKNIVSFEPFGVGLGDRHQQIVDGVTTNYTLWNMVEFDYSATHHSSIKKAV